MKQLNIPDDINEVRKLRFCAWLRKRLDEYDLTSYVLTIELKILARTTIDNHVNGTYFPKYDSMLIYFNYFDVPNDNSQYVRMYEAFRQVEMKFKKLKRIEDRKKEKMSFETL